MGKRRTVCVVPSEEWRSMQTRLAVAEDIIKRISTKNRRLHDVRRIAERNVEWLPDNEAEQMRRALAALKGER